MGLISISLHPSRLHRAMTCGSSRPVTATVTRGAIPSAESDSRIESPSPSGSEVEQHDIRPIAPRGFESISHAAGIANAMTCVLQQNAQGAYDKRAVFHDQNVRANRQRAVRTGTVK